MARSVSELFFQRFAHQHPLSEFGDCLGLGHSRANAKEKESSTCAGINREIGHPSDHRIHLIMKIRLLIGAVATSLLIMAGLATGEKLAKADGTVSAKTLPLDKRLASKKFETATFGLG